MYWRLTGALPDLVVLAQVGQSAFLKSNDIAVFRSFSQKVTDFVVCDKAFNVLAIIELDDASHKRKKDKDAQRDAVITAAGLRVIRYANIPDIAKVHEDFRAERIKLLEQKMKLNAQAPQADGNPVTA